MEIRLDGRAALITGGSMGIGLAIATEFARSGADVALVARGREVLEAAGKQLRALSKSRVIVVPGDVADATSLKSAYEEALGGLGHIDILVNNAGTSRSLPFEDVTDEMWREDLELKLFAAIRLSRLVWPGMKARRWGRIINVLNLGAKAPAARSAPTSVSRAAGMALTKVLANEGAADNILVNALLVGRIESEQWERAAAREGIPVSDFLGRMGKDIPLGRVGTAQEFANIACFLASDAASYITGTATNVDGGRSPVV
jgi:3-oxoacyl-[acyl-carrier protein] reductase